jgi:hypothetical protein
MIVNKLGADGLMRSVYTRVEKLLSLDVLTVSLDVRSEKHGESQS